MTSKCQSNFEVLIKVFSINRGLRYFKRLIGVNKVLVFDQTCSNGFVMVHVSSSMSVEVNRPFVGACRCLFEWSPYSIGVDLLEDLVDVWRVCLFTILALLTLPGAGHNLTRLRTNE